MYLSNAVSAGLPWVRNRSVGSLIDPTDLYDGTDLATGFKIHP